MYRVFHRTWWRENPRWPNGLEPCAGRKTTAATVETEEEARALCREANSSPNNFTAKQRRLGRKYEYEEV